MELALVCDGRIDGKPLQELRRKCASQGVMLFEFPRRWQLRRKAVGVVYGSEVLCEDFLRYCESSGIPILITARKTPVTEPPADLGIAVVFAPEIAQNDGLLDAAKTLAKADLDPGVYMLSELR